MYAILGVVGLLSDVEASSYSPWIWIGVGVFVLFIIALNSIGIRYIPNNRVGVVEKLWSGSGSVPGGGVLALNGEAGYQASLLRGGMHFGYWRWQYRIHKTPL